jgi:hypothetical protein
MTLCEATRVDGGREALRVAKESGAGASTRLCPRPRYRRQSYSCMYVTR